MLNLNASQERQFGVLDPLLNKVYGIENPQIAREIASFLPRLPTRHRIHEVGFEITAFCLSPDNEYIATAYRTKWNKKSPKITMIKYWNIATGECTRRKEISGGEITALLLSPNQQYLVYNLSHRHHFETNVWDTVSDTIIQIYLEENYHPFWYRSPVSLLHIQADNRTMVIVSDKNEESIVQIWDIPSNTCIKELKGIGRYRTKRVLVDDQFMVCLKENGILEVWDIMSGTCLRKMTIQAEELFTANSQYIITRRKFPFSQFFFHDVWNFTTGEHINRWVDTHFTEPRAIHITPNNQYVLTNSPGRIEVRNICDGYIMTTLNLNARDWAVLDVGIASDTSFLVTANTWGEIKLWDLYTGEPMEKKKAKKKKPSKKSPKKFGLTTKKKKVNKNNKRKAKRKHKKKA